MTKTHDVPEATLEDRLHTLAKAGIASIPVVGAAASELFTESSLRHLKSVESIG